LLVCVRHICNWGRGTDTLARVIFALDAIAKNAQAIVPVLLERAFESKRQFLI
jgi:hypothetical protein